MCCTNINCQINTFKNSKKTTTTKQKKNTFVESLFFCLNMSKCTKCLRITQVKGILRHGALKVKTEVEQSGVCFQVWHSLPTLSVLLVHTDLYSRSVLKQMTPGSPTIDHNKKNTPTAYCSNLPLKRHPLSLFLRSLLLHSNFPCYVLFNSSSYALLPQSPSPVSHFMFLSRVFRLPSLCGYTVIGA